MRGPRGAFSFGRSADERGRANRLESHPSPRVEVSFVGTKRHSDGSAIPSPVDLEITQGFLDSTVPSVRSNRSSRQSSRQATESDARQSFPNGDRLANNSSQPSALGVPQGDGSRLTSKTWTTISNHVSCHSRSSSSRSSSAAHEFNRLAQSHGLHDLSHYQPGRGTQQQTEQNDEIGTSLLSKLPSKGWLFRKLIRKTPASRPQKPTPRRSVPRKMSSMDVNGTDGDCVQSLRSKSLEDIARLGGISILSLPPDYSPCALAVPTCMAATGNYVAQNWSITTGIFRIPGSHTTVHTLLKHYLGQINHADKGSDRVQETVSSAILPAHISYDVDDVASAFKKFLSCFPGGILGSWWLFSILRDISTHDFAAESSQNPHAGDDARAKLIALGIAGLDAPLRIAIICAVFGLLNMIGAEAESKIRWKDGRRESQPTEKMGYQALGVVFGPLLAGDMIDQIQLDGHSRSGSSSGGVTRNPRRPSRMKVANSQQQQQQQQQHDDLTTQLARTNITVQITEMLITEWVGVVRELRRIGLPGFEQYASRSESLGVALEYGNEISRADDSLARARSYDLMPGSVRSSYWRASPMGMRHPHLAYSTSRRTYDRPRSRMDSKRIRIRSKGSRQHLNGYASGSVLRDGKTPGSRNESLLSSRYHQTSMPAPLPPPAPNSTARSSTYSYVHTPVNPSVGSTPRGSFEFTPSPRLSGVVVGVFDAPQPRFMPYRPNTASSAMAPTEQQELQANSLTPQSVNFQRGDGTTNALAEVKAGADDVAQSDLASYHGAGPPDATIPTTPTALKSQESTPRPPTGLSRLSSVQSSQTSPLPPVLRKQLPTPSPKAHGQTMPARCSFEVLPGAMDQDGVFEPNKTASPGTRNDQVPDTARTSRLPSHRIPHRLSSCLKGQGGLCRSAADSRRSDRGSQLTTDSDMSARTPEEPTLHQARYMTLTRPYSLIGATDEQGSPSEPQTRTGSSVNNGSVRLHSPTNGPSKGNATLYAEIQRLQRLLDVRTEEATQAQRELQAMRDFRDSRALSEQLRETQKALKAWKARAEWAERRAFTLDWEWKKSYANMNAGPAGPRNGKLTSS